jgi:DNA-binding MarR family transcriptional regulator
LFASSPHLLRNDSIAHLLPCQKLGINRTDLRCLNIVDNQGPMTAGRLAELSGLTTAAVTTVLDRLERAGYARRVRNQTAGR